MVGHYHSVRHYLGWTLGLQIQPVSNRNGKLKGCRPSLIKREPVTSEHKRRKRDEIKNTIDTRNTKEMRRRTQEHKRQKRYEQN